MFKKGLVLGMSLIAGLVYSPIAHSANECCGWYGPISPHGDTGHIKISDLHTQGELSLNFVVKYVEGDSSYPHADFCKYFGGIELPDSLKWDIRADTARSGRQVEASLVVVYRDTVWVAMCGVCSNQNWSTFTMDSSTFANGEIISPDTVYPHLPPHRIDSLRFRVHQYGPDCPPKPWDVDILIDNLRFFYENIDTLVDAMGDKTGAEETTPIYKQKLKIYPNPCHSTIKISYCLSTSEQVLLEVLDITGSKIATLEEKKPAGKHKKIWGMRDEKGEELPSGIYFLRMTTKSSSSTKKVVLLR